MDTSLEMTEHTPSTGMQSNGMTADFWYARTGRKHDMLTGIVYDIVVQQASNMDHLCDFSYPLLSPPLLHDTRQLMRPELPQ